ncbi:hypothetical protein Q5P01_000737 [Channa striata]|uniref:Uncharacterized protein n=1 Tax=Channa striata TaxID=64152 RepID=A0AA88LIU5_CHASR|nr:hypothetical protein Q5P01_000737 [Channa striata]
MIRLPSAFSVLAENENVLVLRHLLRDAVAIVPKGPEARRRTKRSRPAERGARREGAATCPMGHVTEWFPCGHSAFRIESGVRGAPRLLVSCRAGRGESTREDFGGGRSDSGVPTLHVHRSPEYHAEAVPEGLRTNKHLFDRSACLLPGTMDVIAPPELSLAACVAVMYAFEVFSSLAGVDDRRETLAGLSFTGNLGPREACALVLTYLQLEERSARRLEKSVVRFEALSSFILSELRALVASRPEVGEGLRYLFGGQPRGRGGPRARLADDLCFDEADEPWPCAAPAPLSDRGDCYFQLNYSRGSGRIAGGSGDDAREGLLSIEAMTGLERAVRSEDARGYEEPRLARIFRTCRRKAGRCRFEVSVDGPPVEDPACGEPLYARSWLGGERHEAGPSAIGDGEFFPAVEVARPDESDDSDSSESLSRPLPEYNLNLATNARPKRYAMERADRCPGERGWAYEACLDEAVLLGHCARLLVTGGAKKNFDVSACLTWFYRAVHPCVPEMNAGDVMLDYEFELHGRGALPPVYALLGHLAESSRVNCFPACKLITLSRHRGASAWTRSTDAQFHHSSKLRINTLGAFLCSRDHRLTPLLTRCCEPKPLRGSELRPGGELLPRGDEELLLLRAYSETLGPVFEFERVERLPSDEPRGLDVSQADERRDLELGVVVQAPRRRRDRRLHRGVRVGIAAVLPAGAGPLVQKLESVAVVVESGSLYRTDVLKSEDPEWPDPDRLELRDRIECKGKASVIDEMFMRPGGRDPLDGYAASDSSWKGITGARWTYHKALERTGSLPRDWEPDYPVSASAATIGRRPRPDESTIEWLCPAPPVAFSQVARESGPGRRFAPLRIDSRAARARDPAEWRGFDALCSRVLSCPLEKRWTRGLCVVVNKGWFPRVHSALVPSRGLALRAVRAERLDRSRGAARPLSSAAEARGARPHRPEALIGGQGPVLVQKVRAAAELWERGICLRIRGYVQRSGRRRGPALRGPAFPVRGSILQPHHLGRDVARRSFRGDRREARSAAASFCPVGTRGRKGRGPGSSAGGERGSETGRAMGGACDREEERIGLDVRASQREVRDLPVPGAQ